MEHSSLSTALVIVSLLSSVLRSAQIVHKCCSALLAIAGRWTDDTWKSDVSAATSAAHPAGQWEKPGAVWPDATLAGADCRYRRSAGSSSGNRTDSPKEEGLGAELGVIGVAEALAQTDYTPTQKEIVKTYKVFDTWSTPF